MLAGRIVANGRRLVVADSRPIGDPDLDTLLAALTPRGQPFRPGVGLRHSRRLPGRYLSRLRARGLVTQHDRLALGVFRVTRYHLTDSQTCSRLRLQVDDAVQAETSSPPTGVALASLAFDVGLGRTLYPGREGRALRRRFNKSRPIAPESLALVMAAVRQAVVARQAAASGG